MTGCGCSDRDYYITLSDARERDARVEAALSGLPEDQSKLLKAAYNYRYLCFPAVLTESGNVPGTVGNVTASDSWIESLKSYILLYSDYYNGLKKSLDRLIKKILPQSDNSEVYSLEMVHENYAAPNGVISGYDANRYATDSNKTRHEDMAEITNRVVLLQNQIENLSEKFVKSFEPLFLCRLTDVRDAVEMIGERMPE